MLQPVHSLKPVGPYSQVKGQTCILYCFTFVLCFPHFKTHIITASLEALADISTILRDLQLFLIDLYEKINPDSGAMVSKI